MTRGQDDQDAPKDREEDHLKDKVQVKDCREQFGLRIEPYDDPKGGDMTSPPFSIYSIGKGIYERLDPGL
ncbi:hypothetical protein GCM10022394_25390 [Zobellella aerophila]|uniref:Uncharacterized protein n=1 Tax=Zobellella aerophila TaxID=870480 RepID=A0ABP6W1K1_9GAMM